jgi:hypothetical protein
MAYGERQHENRRENRYETKIIFPFDNVDVGGRVWEEGTQCHVLGGCGNR